MSFWRILSSKKSRFMNAAIVGDLAEIKAMLIAGVSVNAKRGDGVTALLLASEVGHLEVVRALLTAGADVNFKMDDGHTALMSASNSGHLEIVQLLLGAGADANVKMFDGGTAWSYARDPKVRQIIHDATARANNFVSTGDAAQVKSLIDSNTNVNWKNDKGETALIRASLEGRLDAAQVLLAAGADVNAKNNFGETALMWSSRHGHLEIVRILLAAKADANAKDKDGNTALMWVPQYGRPAARSREQKDLSFQEESNTYHRQLEIVQALLAANADVNAKTQHLSTKAMWEASLRNHEEISTSLALQRKHECDAMANVDSTEQMTDGSTALMWASSEGHLEIVRALLAAGADVNAERRDGLTALIFASTNGYFEIVQDLLTAGADVNARTRQFSNTALKVASRNGHQDVIQLLKKAGAAE